MEWEIFKIRLSGVKLEIKKNLQNHFELNFDNFLAILFAVKWRKTEKLDNEFN